MKNISIVGLLMVLLLSQGVMAGTGEGVSKDDFNQWVNTCTVVQGGPGVPNHLSCPTKLGE